MDADTALPSRAAKPTTSESQPPRRPFSLAARAALATGFVLAAFLGAGRTDAVAHQCRSAHCKACRTVCRTSSIAYHRRHRGRAATARCCCRTRRPTRVSRGQARGSMPWPSATTASNGNRLRRSGATLVSSSRWRQAKDSFVGPVDTRMGRLYYYSYGVALDTRREEVGAPHHHGGADRRPARRRQRRLPAQPGDLARRSLGVMLIVLQMLLLRWSLTPLRKVASDMTPGRARRQRASGQPVSARAHGPYRAHQRLHRQRARAAHALPRIPWRIWRTA